MLNAKPFRLGRVLGIPIMAHYSWIPVFPLYAWVISSALLPRTAPGRPQLEYWALGLLTTVLLFGSVLGHELAHSVVARVEGIGTGAITLYLFGGLSSLASQPAKPSSEFKIAVAGPAASFILGAVFFAVDQAVFYRTSYLAPSQVFRHLGIVNWLLAGFNILPGLPLDGGRVLRAFVWRVKKNYVAATRVATQAGITIALALLVAGIFMFLHTDMVFGLWSVIIGLLLAGMLFSQVRIGRSGSGRTPGTVGALMTRDVVMVSPNLGVQQFIDQVLSNNRFTSFPVADRRRLHGLLTLERLKDFPKAQWPSLTARDVMIPVNESLFIDSRSSVAQARTLLAKNGIGRAAVLDSNGLIIGYISKSDLGAGKTS